MEFLFQGESYHSVDSGGRIIVPNRFRFSLGERFIFTRGIHGCIFVFRPEAYAAMSEGLNKQKTFDPHTLILQRVFTSVEASMDTQGRVALPINLRDHAGIKESSDIVMVGAGDRIEIWAKDRWDAYNATISDAMILEAWARIQNAEVSAAKDATIEAAVAGA